MSSGNPFAKVQPGQALKIPAVAYNAFIDVATANQSQHRRAGNGDISGPSGQVVQIKNTTEDAVPRFGVMGIVAPIFPPEDEVPATQLQVSLGCIAPDIALHLNGRIVIALAPLAADAIGPALVDGVGFVKIFSDLDSASIRFADIEDDETAYLVPASSGVQVLWVADLSGEEAEARWAVVRLGGGSGDASQLYQIQSIENDYLVCRTWDGTTLGDTDINIAKPWLLQHDVERYAHLSTLDTVDAQTVDIETDGAVEAQWKIAPAYAVDDLIQAVPRLTGVMVSEEELTLMDINHDARAWAEVVPPPE